MRLPSKTIVVISALIGFVVMSVAFAAPPERKFKNLKVLPRNIGEKELDSIMKSFTRGLNVKCNFCHVNDKTDPSKMDFPNDEKAEKNIARKMIKLTNKINKKWFDYEKDPTGKTIQSVTCYTCHHGEPHAAKGPKPQQRPQEQ